MEGFTNINQIMNRITQHPLMSDIPFDTVVDYTIDFMEIVCVPEMFEEKTALVDIDEHRGQLPSDFVQMIQVRDPHSKVTYRYSTDSFFYTHDNHGPDFTYKMKGNVIFTNNRAKCVEISYLAIPVDNECIPLIPDSRVFQRALEAYIKVRWFTILFDTDKIKIQSLQNAQQEYAFAVGACETDMRKLTIDKAESLFAGLRNIVPKLYEHRVGFKDNNNDETIRRHQ